MSPLQKTSVFKLEAWSHVAICNINFNERQKFQMLHLADKIQALDTSSIVEN